MNSIAVCLVGWLAAYPANMVASNLLPERNDTLAENDSVANINPNPYRRRGLRRRHVPTTMVRPQPAMVGAGPHADVVGNEPVAAAVTTGNDDSTDAGSVGNEVNRALLQPWPKENVMQISNKKTPIKSAYSWKKSLLWSLLLAMVGAGLCVLLQKMRRVLPKVMGDKLTTSAMQLIATYPLGPKSQLLLFEVLHEKLLLAQNGDSLTILHHFEQPGEESLEDLHQMIKPTSLRPAAPPSSKDNGFGNTLTDVQGLLRLKGAEHHAMVGR